MPHPAKILRELGVSPRKRLGQHFQIDVHAIGQAAPFIPKEMSILEIGPGLGAWTAIFLARGHSVIAVEKDPKLAHYLEHRFSGNPCLTVICGDFLSLSHPLLQGCGAAIGNLPFSITSSALLRVAWGLPQVHYALFGVQFEVAERIAAGRGSALAISLNYQGHWQLLAKVSRNSFYPKPQVDAALVAFERQHVEPRPYLRELLKAAFWGKRKMLKSALARNPFWERSPETACWKKRLQELPADLAALLELRAEELSVSDFCQLYDQLNHTKA
ncbi:MAG: hypothetical protein N2Z22_01875 [Turneriella sp.]|nr:hypothetical protein [Turneriella sp.]